MTQAKEGDIVRVHYTGKLGDGEVFDSSSGSDPLEFTLGTNQVIPGFEGMVVGMEPGQSKSSNIPVDNAYGPRDDDMIIVLDKDRLPSDMEPEVGQTLQLQTDGGGAFQARVMELDDSTVTLDANHPLAGKNLTFEIELVEIC